MALEDFLSGLRSLQDSSTAAAGTAEKIRQQDAMAQLNQATPDLISKMRDAQASGDTATVNQLMGQYIPMAQSAGIPAQADVAKDWMKQAFAPPDKKGAGYDATAIKSLGLSPEQEKVAISLAGQPDRQQKYLDTTQKVEKTAQGEARLGERISQDKEAVVSKLRSDMGHLEKDIADRQSKGEEMQKYMKNNDSLSDAVLFTYVARHVSEDKGPINEAEMARIIGIPYVQGTFKEQLAKFTGDTYQKLSDQQKSQIMNVIKQSIATFNDKAKMMAADTLNRYADSSKLKDENGMPGPILQKYAKKHGVEIDPDTGGFVVSKGTETVTGNKAALLSQAQKTLDADHFTAYKAKLNSLYPGDIPDDQLTPLSTKLKQRGQQ